MDVDILKMILKVSYTVEYLVKNSEMHAHSRVESSQTTEKRGSDSIIRLQPLSFFRSIVSSLFVMVRIRKLTWTL